MRTIVLLASASIAVLAGPAMADDRLHLTPPLYREQARATQETRPASDLTTQPRIVPAARPASVGSVSPGNNVVVAAGMR